MLIFFPQFEFIRWNGTNRVALVDEIFPAPPLPTEAAATTELGNGLYSPLASLAQPSEFDRSLYTEDIFDFLY